MGRTFRIYYFLGREFDKDGKYFEVDSNYSQCCKEILTKEFFPTYYDSYEPELETPKRYSVQDLKEILEKEMVNDQVDYFTLLSSEYYDNEITAFAKCISSIVEDMRHGEEEIEYVWIKVTSG